MTGLKQLSNYIPWMKQAGWDVGLKAGTPTESSMPTGALAIDTTNGKLYQNTGTVVSATWQSLGEIIASEISLAEGNLLVGNSSGVGVALVAKTSGQILVGNGTTLVSVALSGDATLASNGAITVVDLTLGSDAAGDMFYKTSATVTARLAKGTAGQYLQMNSGATAPEWVSLSGDATISNGVITVVDLTLGSDAAGDMFYKTSATVTSRLAKGTAYQVLRMNSAATAPEWGLVYVSALVGSEARTATADGLTTGAITTPTAFRTFITVTSGAATDAITLPVISSTTIGQEVFLTVTTNGYELLTPASSNNTINQVDSDGTNQLDVAANTTVRCTQISATAWLAETIAATTIAITAPDND